MATYDEIPDSELAVDAPVKSSTHEKLRDNPLAALEGDPTAKAENAGLFIEFDGGGGSQTGILTDETDTSKVLAPDGVGGAEWVGGGSGARVEVFDTNGSFAVPAGVAALVVEVWGGGGGGGNSGGAGAGGSGGGGSGGYTRAVLAVTPLDNLTVVVGAGGAGGAGGAQSSFDTAARLRANGGAVGAAGFVLGGGAGGAGGTTVTSESEVEQFTGADGETGSGTANGPGGVGGLGTRASSRISPFLTQGQMSAGGRGAAGGGAGLGAQGGDGRVVVHF
jgi:hypothetical protein